MRSDKQMLNLILETAMTDDRIRIVIMNGSRANPEYSPGYLYGFRYCLSGHRPGSLSPES